MSVARVRVVAGWFLGAKVAFLVAASPVHADVLTEPALVLARQLRACQHLENQLFGFVQTPFELTDVRELLLVNIDCLRELISDLDTATGLGITDDHLVKLREHLDAALKHEEKDLERVDERIATGKGKILGGLVKAIQEKAHAGGALRDLERTRQAVSPEVSDFDVEEDTPDDPPSVPPPVPAAATNVKVWDPKAVGKDPAETAGWEVRELAAKLGQGKVTTLDGTKLPVFTFRGTEDETLGTASYTTDDALTPPVIVQTTGGLHSTKEKDALKAALSRYCLTVDREPQTDPPQFYGVCTVHRTEPFGTQVFDFTNAGLAGGNEFFADETLVSIQIAFDGDTIHTEVQPRGEPDDRVVLQDELVLDEPWQAIRAGFGATALRKGAKLRIEPVVAWSFPVAYVVTFEVTDLLAGPDDTAADLGNVPSGSELDVFSKSADGRFLEVEFEGQRGWIAKSAGIAFNVASLLP